MKDIIITGSSGGMGLATSKIFIEHGYHVFGLDIVEPKEKLDNFTFIKTDIRNEESIKKAYEEVKKTTSIVEAIITMSGTYNLDSLIEINEEDFIKIFDINVFALYRVNKIFLPLLKEKGKIVMVSSELAPLDPLPFTGLYGITKSTVEKYAYSLRMELQLLNKYVVIIRPGAVSTSMISASTTALNRFTKSTTHYKYNAERFNKIVNNVESRKIPPLKIANLTLKIINKKKPRYVYKINRNPLLLLLNILPDKLQNWIIKQILIK